jgi:hypothetical protein
LERVGSFDRSTGGAQSGTTAAGRGSISLGKTLMS